MTPVKFSAKWVKRAAQTRHDTLIVMKCGCCGGHMSVVLHKPNYYEFMCFNMACSQYMEPASAPD